MNESKKFQAGNAWNFFLWMKIGQYDIIERKQEIVEL